MKDHIQRTVALVIVYAFLTSPATVVACAAEPAPVPAPSSSNLVNPALLAGIVPVPRTTLAEPEEQRSWTKKGKILTFIGVVTIGAGAVMMTRDKSTIYVGDSSEMRINWRATGAVWLGVGGVLTAVGLTRRK